MVFGVKTNKMLVRENPDLYGFKDRKHHPTDYRYFMVQRYVE